MNIESLRHKLPPEMHKILSVQITELRPAQEKAVAAGLLEQKSLLICTPTASGKTLIAELAAITNILDGVGKAVYIVPLKSLATEKYREFLGKYKGVKVALSIGDPESTGRDLSSFDMIITTSEKLDSLTRHHVPWLRDVKTVIVDEIHLLNDPGRGPTLEILITILRKMLKNIQLIGLSATIGNPQELAEWLGAELILDDWRPVELKKGVLLDGQIEFEG